MKSLSIKCLKLPLALILSVFMVTLSNALEIKPFETEKGIKVYLVEDYTLPIIAMKFAFKGGTTQDEKGKEGTVNLMSSLLDEGAGDLDNVAFQSKMEEMGISISFGASSADFSGGFRTIRSDLETATMLLKLAINEPRFDESAIERMTDAIKLGIKRSETSPGAQASKAQRIALFEGHPYARESSGTLESLAAITRDDLIAMKKKIFTRANLSIGVVGAISEAELGEFLDEVFGELPKESQITEVASVEPNFGQEETLEMQVPNASIRLIYKGVKREDPKFFTAYLMNHILGGGVFSSRLYDEIREKRGLVYGVSSSINSLDYSSYFAAGTSTRAENLEEVVSLIKQEINKIKDKGVTQKELESAKQYVSGAYAINNFDSSLSVAGVLLSLQTENLGIDYIDKREELINSVTVEDVNQLAKELFSVEPTTIIVKPPVSQ